MKSIEEERRESQTRFDRLRREQERNDDLNRRNRQRREDQRRQDEFERRRQAAERERLAELKRHNRALEMSRSRPSPLREDAQEEYDQISYEPSPHETSALSKLVIAGLIVWAIYHFWPDIYSIVSSSVQDASITQTGKSAKRVIDPDGQSVLSTKPLPPQTNRRSLRKYPRCSAVITDGCQQDH